MKLLLTIIIFFLFIGINLHGQINLDSGLVAYYPFNGNAIDESGKDNHGEVIGATLTSDRVGNLNSTYSFDGIDDYIDIGNDSLVKPQLPMTIAAWIYLEKGGFIFVNNFDDQNYFGIYLRVNFGDDGAPKTVAVGIGDGGVIGPSSRRTKRGISDLEPGQWYHIVGVLKDLTDMDIYINAINDSGIYVGSGDSLAYNDNSGNIGRGDSRYSGPPEYFGGKIDDIRFYNRALTEEEVIALSQLKPPYLSADFKADTTFGEPPLTVSFTDQSSTNDTLAINSWMWDFNNDGTVDSQVQNPQWTYETEGSYSVKLIVSNGVLSDTLLIHNYINIITVYESPTILSIQDIPNDQGGWVYVEFIRSIYDTDSLKNQKLNLNSTEFYTVEINDGSGWTTANTTGAYGKTKYTSIVHTPFDSTDYSEGILDFRVIAFMEEGNYVSKVVTGYSTDNLAPATPTGFLAFIYEVNKIKLTWNQVHDNDVNYFRIYRGFDSSPDLDQVYDIATDTSYIDTQVILGKAYYYRITSVDFAGNESNFSEEIMVSVTLIENDKHNINKFILGQNYPNPFNPITKIKFSIPKQGNVKIELFNTLGKKIKTLLNQSISSGYHEIQFNAHDLSSGIYLYRIQFGKFQDVKKMIVLK